MHWINHVVLNCWVVIRDVIRSLYIFQILYLLKLLIFVKFRRLRLFCFSLVPDPTKNETVERGNHWNNRRENIANDEKREIPASFHISRKFSEISVIDKKTLNRRLVDHRQSLYNEYNPKEATVLFVKIDESKFELEHYYQAHQYYHDRVYNA